MLLTHLFKVERGNSWHVERQFHRYDEKKDSMLAEYTCRIKM